MHPCKSEAYQNANCSLKYVDLLGISFPISQTLIACIYQGRWLKFTLSSNACETAARLI